MRRIAFQAPRANPGPTPTRVTSRRKVEDDGAFLALVALGLAFAGFAVALVRPRRFGWQTLLALASLLALGVDLFFAHAEWASVDTHWGFQAVAALLAAAGVVNVMRSRRARPRYERVLGPPIPPPP